MIFLPKVQIKEPRKRGGEQTRAQLSAFLNLSRWLAASLVLIGHVRHLVLVDMDTVKHKSIFIKALYFATGLGHEAVVIFFVISGYLVGGITLSRWRKDGPDSSSYAAARFSRIYTVLIPALLIGLAFDVAGLDFFNASQLYTRPEQWHTISLSGSLVPNMSASTFFGNLFMMQGILSKPLGSNVPLWSLSYEWWYYAVFALMTVAILKRGSDASALICCALAASIVILLPFKIVLWGTIWALGIAGYIWIGSRAWRPHPILGMCVFVATITISRLSHKVGNVASHESLSTEFERDLMLALGYLFALASISRLKVKVPLATFHERLADFSYTTYLCHFPALLLTVAIAYQVFGVPFQVQPGAFGLLYFVGAVACLYAYCFAFSLLTERNTDRIRKALLPLFGAAPIHRWALEPEKKNPS